jgi:hypothetical protein
MWKGSIILDDYDILQAGDIHRLKLNNSEPSAPCNTCHNILMSSPLLTAIDFQFVLFPECSCGVINEL